MRKISIVTLVVLSLLLVVPLSSLVSASDGSLWSPMTSNTENPLYGVWGSSATDVFAVGQGNGNGTILHYNGSTWSAMTIGTTNVLLGVWGSSSSDVFAVGGEGTILHFDGSAWSLMNTVNVGGERYDLQSVWGSDPNNVFAIGYLVSSSNLLFYDIILRYDGTSWGLMDSYSYQFRIWGVWGSSSRDVFAVGEYGTILQYNGTAWRLMSSGTTNPLYGVWGSSATDVFAVGDYGTILQYNGTAWRLMNSGTVPEALYAVWGSSANSVFAVGEYGTILHYPQTSSKGVPWWVWLVAILVVMASGAALVFSWRKKKTQPDVGLEPEVQAEPGEPMKWVLPPSIGGVTPSPTQELDRVAGVVLQALKTMDSTGGRYAGEEAANRELATSLKLLMPDAKVESQARVKESTTVDLRIGNILVEGKLELQHKTEADRLIGQLDGYCIGTSYGVIVVGYGEIAPILRYSIEKKIAEHYPDRVRLVTLPHPQRRGKPSST